MSMRDGLGVDEVFQIGADVALQVLGPDGVAHRQVHGGDGGGVELAVGHGAGDQGGAGVYPLAEVGDVPLGQLGHGPIAHPVVAEDVGVAGQGGHEGLAL